MQEKIANILDQQLVQKVAALVIQRNSNEERKAAGMKPLTRDEQQRLRDWAYRVAAEVK
jgi:hypothetical protein